MLSISARADVVTDAQSTRNEITSSDSESRDVLGELYVIQKRVKDISKQRARLNAMMLSNDGDAQALAQSVSLLERQLNAQRLQLSRRLGLLYRWNSPNLLPFLFTSATAVEFERNMRFVRLLSEKDFQYLKQYQRTLELAHQQRSKLKSKIGVLISLKKQMQDEESKMGKVFQQKSNLLAKLKQKKELNLKTLKALRENHPELEGMLKTGFFEKRGHLKPPVEGAITSFYGTFYDKKFSYRLLKKGWHYKTEKQDVHSLFEGEVAFAGKLPGYGLAAIIDHGDHYYTVYGGLTKLNVSVDDTVHEAGVIGSSEKHLYFEIRHFSEALDPAAWIANENKKEIASLGGNQ